MAELTNDVDMETSTNETHKRVFGEITNAGTTTGQPKKPKEEPEKKTYTLNWTAAERATKAAPSNAMVLSDVCRQPYGIVTSIQETHAPTIKPTAAFVTHEGANILAAVQARKSGAGRVRPAGRLEIEPLWGGISSRKNAPAPPANIVGLDEKLSAGAKKGNVRKARRKKARGCKGVSPSFGVWFDGKFVGKYKDNVQKVAPDIKQKHPGEYMTYRLLSCLLGDNKRNLLRNSKFLKEKFDATKFTAKYD